jgi:hypothetical protein
MPWKAVVDWRTEQPWWRAYGRVVVAEARDGIDAAIAEEAPPDAVVTVHLITEIGPSAYAMYQTLKAKQREWKRLAASGQAGRGLL